MLGPGRTPVYLRVILALETRSMTDLQDLVDQLKAIQTAAAIPDDRKNDLVYVQAALEVIKAYVTAALDKLEPLS